MIPSTTHALRIGVVLDECPGAAGQLLLRGLVRRALLGVASQPVTERQHAPDLGRAFGERVEVDVGVRALEQAVLVPVGFADREPVARRDHVRDICVLVAAVGHGEDDVDHGLRRQTRDGRGAGVLQLVDAVTERGADPDASRSYEAGHSGLYGARWIGLS